MERAPMEERVERVHRTTGFYDLSCDCLPRHTRDELARIAQYPNTKLRESTVGRIRNAGFQIFPSPTGRSRAHCTLRLPDPLSDRDWEKLEEIFEEPVNNVATLEGSE
jgi:hypothetical protein